MRTSSTLALSLSLCAGATSAEETLCKRLGGYDGIAAVTDAFISRLAAGSAFERFFVGHSEIGHRIQRQHVVNFVCEATGGPSFYTGRDLKTAHTGLGITDELWGEFGAHFGVTLDQFGASDELEAEVFALLGGVQGDIVEIE